MAETLACLLPRQAAAAQAERVTAARAPMALTVIFPQAGWARKWDKAAVAAHPAP
jgi:hypothetical protein